MHLIKNSQVKNIVGDFFFLWELPPEILKQPGFEALLPLLPLTKGGKNLETVDEMIKELIARDRSDLLELGHFLTKLGHGSTIAQFLLEKDAGLIAARQGQQPDWANL